MSNTLISEIQHEGCHSDSSSEWFDNIPTHWKVSQLKYVCISIQTGKTPSEEFLDTSSSSDDTIDWFTPGDFGDSLGLTDSRRKISKESIVASEAPLFPAGTVFVVGIGATLGKVGYINNAASTNQQINALLPNHKTETKFLAYLMFSLRNFLMNLANSATLPILNQQRMGEISLALPPVIEQQAIAGFLDHETAKLDQLIEEQERLLKLLTEKRRALITHAVTRGLDPDVPMRNSGMEWLGEIPAHWKTVKIKHVAKVGNGSTPFRDNESYWKEGSFPWLTSTVVNCDIVGEPTEFVTETALREYHLPIIQPDSVLIAITGEGKTRGKATLLHYSATINQHLAFISPQKDLLDPEFLQLALSASYETLRMISEGTGSTKGALTCEQVGEFLIPLPPLTEQRKILTDVSSTKVRIDVLAEGAEEGIALLYERRMALISAAVTGQIRVTTESCNSNVSHSPNSVSSSRQLSLFDQV